MWRGVPALRLLRVATAPAAATALHSAPPRAYGGAGVLRAVRHRRASSRPRRTKAGKAPPALENKLDTTTRTATATATASAATSTSTSTSPWTTPLAPPPPPPSAASQPRAEPAATRVAPPPQAPTATSPGARPAPPQTSPPTPELEGTIKRVTFYSRASGMCVMELVDSAGVSHVVRATTPPVFPGEGLLVRGSWQIHRKYGKQFVANGNDAAALQLGHLSRPNDAQLFLASGPLELSKTTLRSLVAGHGDGSLQLVDERPDALLQLRGFGFKTVAKVRSNWLNAKHARNFVCLLLDTGLSPRTVVESLARLASSGHTLVEIEDDPYRLMYVPLDVPLSLIDTLATSLNVPHQAFKRTCGIIMQLLLQAESRGDCAIPVTDAVARAKKLFRLKLSPEELSDLVEEGPAPFVLDTIKGKPFVFSRELHELEQRVAKSVIHLAGVQVPGHMEQGNVTEAVNAAMLSFARPGQGRTPVALSKSQSKALHSMLAAKVCVLTGGPGVGKTKLLQVFVNLIEANGNSVLMCAPTGRAAQRLSESTGQGATTMHRMLGASDTGECAYNESRPLEADVVVVDEASMVDVRLMDMLLRAMPDDTILVLVGDVDQLPPVRPGNVLRSIIESGAVQVVELTEIHRQAKSSSIVVGSHAINQGKRPDLADDIAKSDLVFLPMAGDRWQSHVVDLVQNKIPELAGLSSQDVQVLCPMKAKGQVSTQPLNRRLQQALNPSAVTKDAVRVEATSNTFYLQDKVMQVQNDNDQGVYNGEIGVVSFINRDPSDPVALEVTFPGDRVTKYLAADLDARLTLAYAITIHKAQGSEFPVVVIPLHLQQAAMLRRNLLYTAMTRGRKLVVIIGQQAALNIAVHEGPDSAGQERYSKLSEWLQG